MHFSLLLQSETCSFLSMEGGWFTHMQGCFIQRASVPNDLEREHGKDVVGE